MKNTIQITSSIVISDEIKSILESKLLTKIGNYPFVYTVDASLIAGLKVQFNDIENRYDLASEIRHIENELIHN